MPSLSIASIAHTARLAVLGSFLILTLPAAQAAELPNSAELQYVGPYHVPVNMTFNRTGNTYAVALRIHVPLYQIRFQSSGSISNNTLRPAVYMDTRNGKPYAEAHFSGHDVRYGKTGAEIQTSALNGPTFDLFSLAWQLAMNDGRLPAKLHITNGKKFMQSAASEKSATICTGWGNGILQSAVTKFNATTAAWNMPLPPNLAIFPYLSAT